MEDSISSQNMPLKRYSQQDPEYEQLQDKRQRLEEHDMRAQTLKKIKVILKRHFHEEVLQKDGEIERIDRLLNESRCILDRLRTCIVTKYYASPQLQSQNDDSIPSVHPAIKKHIGKCPRFRAVSVKPHDTESTEPTPTCELAASLSSSTDNHTPAEPVPIANPSKTEPERNQSNPEPERNQSHVPLVRAKYEIVVGNVSKFVPVAQRGDATHLSHVWKAYVREGKNYPKLADLVQKVCFLLHPSFAPKDLIEIRHPPFEVTKRGWGDFPLRVQIHFKHSCNKPVDIIHRLKLDRTYTGLTTLGPETHAEVRLLVRQDSLSDFEQKSEPVRKEQDKEHTGISDHKVSSEKPCTVQDSRSSGCNGVLEEMQTPTPSCSENNHEAVTENGGLSKHSLPEPSALKWESNPAPVFQSIAKSDAKVQNEELLKSHVPCPSSSSISLPVNKPVYQLINEATPFTKAKCTDLQGRTILVPQSSIVHLKADGTQEKHGNSPSQESHSPGTHIRSLSGAHVLQGAGIVSLQSKQQSPAPVKRTLPLYVLKVVSSHGDSPSQVLLMPSDKGAKSDTQAPHGGVQKNITLNGFTVPGSDPARLILAPSEKAELKRKPQLHWQQTVQNINVSDCTNFEKLLKKLVKTFPLVKQGVDRSLLPFCALSLQDYLSWNIGKRRAAEVACQVCHSQQTSSARSGFQPISGLVSDTSSNTYRSRSHPKWQRAGLIRTAALHVLQNKKINFLKPEDVWTKKQIVSWCKKHGYTPEVTDKLGHVHSSVPEGLPGLTDETTHSDVFEFVSALEKDIPKNERNEIEDCIVEVADDDEHDVKPDTLRLQHQPLISLPCSSGAAFVKEAASQISIALKPVELAPGVSVPVVEEMMFTVCRLFAEDLLRSAICEGYRRKGNKVCPEEVTLLDVYFAVRKIPEFQFLTNKHLAVSKQPLDDS